MKLKGIKMFSIIAGAIIAGGTVIAGAWTVADSLGVRPTLISEHRGLESINASEHRELTQTVGSIKQALDEDKWFRLNRKKKTPQGLTNDEFLEWCALGRRLGFIKVCSR